jgi:hypothetical protein
MNFGSSHSSEAACSTSKPGLSTETLLTAGLVAGCAAHRTKAGKLALLLSLGGLVWRFWNKVKPVTVPIVEPLALPEWTQARRHVVDAELLPSQPAQVPLIRNFPLAEPLVAQAATPGFEPAPPALRKTIADYLRPDPTEIVTPIIAPPTQALHAEPALRFEPIASPVLAKASPAMPLEPLAMDEDASFDPFQSFTLPQASSVRSENETAKQAANATAAWLMKDHASRWDAPDLVPEEQPVCVVSPSIQTTDEPSAHDATLLATMLAGSKADLPVEQPSALEIAEVQEPVSDVIEPSVAPAETTAEAPLFASVAEAPAFVLPQPPATPPSNATVPRMIEPVLERLAAHSPTQPLENWTDVLQGLRKKLGPQVQPPRAPAQEPVLSNPEVKAQTPSLLSSVHLAAPTAPATPPAFAPDASSSAAWLLGIEPMPVIHHDVAWPQSMLAGADTALHHAPASDPLANGGVIPDLVEIPDLAASAVHPAIERAFAKFDASSPMVPLQSNPAPSPTPAPTAKPTTTKGLLGKIFAAESSTKPKTAPLTKPLDAALETLAPPTPAAEAASKPASWITSELRGTRRRLPVDDAANTDVPKPLTAPMIAATPQPITSSPRRIVPRAPTAQASDASKRKGMLSWWK